MRDLFANWLCSRKWAWRWAQSHGSRFAVRLGRLCMARVACGISIRWAHLVSEHGLDDALAAHARRGE
ncbi:hypothetical protein CEY04_27675 [Achromobacter sp. HZ28]|nr:hypothetical protein CEY05_28845 [Achromobacter sp. HZ34]OWT70638.1 hypothetical protein CEY04_27675 [Achromobacter sp. HZ28]